MRPPNPKLLSVITWLVLALVPIALLLTAARLILTPAFIQLEYRTPNFPADPYGMTQAQRLRYAPLALDYLLNDGDISFLAEMTFEDGSPLYNERELRHMQDVKDLTQAGFPIWYLSLAMLAALGLWAWRAHWLDEFKRTLSRGGQLTVFLILAILLFAALSFSAFFVGFHGLFFEGDTWLFLYSDTLIRLFPIRFWRDAVLILGALTIAGGLALWKLAGRAR